MRHTVDSCIVPCGLKSLSGAGKVDVGGEVGDVVGGGAELGAVDDGSGVTVHAVEADGVVVGVEGFVGIVLPGVLDFLVAGGVVGDAFGFEVGPDIGIGPFAHRVELPRGIVGADDILGEGDLAFDEINIGAFLAMKNGVPREVKPTGGALQAIESAEVAVCFDLKRCWGFGAQKEEQDFVGGHLVGFDKIESRGSGLDVVAVLDAVSVGGVVVHLQIPLAGEEVTVGVAVAETGLAPLDDGQFRSYLEKKEVEHGGGIFASAPEHGGVVDLGKPGFDFGRSLANELVHGV